MTRYCRPIGVSVQPIGAIWAAFSESSGETLLLNDEGAAVLEILAQGAAAIDDVIDALANDSGVARSFVADALVQCWPQLVQAGLVRQAAETPDRSR